VGAERERVGQYAADLAGIERLYQEVEDATAHGVNPQAGVGKTVGDQDTGPGLYLSGEIHDIGPTTIGKGCVGEDYRIRLGSQPVARMCQIGNMIHVQWHWIEDLRQAVRIFDMRGNE
jgi:hypothetical protein